MATYYVVSTATGAANGTSETDAWTTIDTAMNNVAANDIVYVKNTATYVERVTIDTPGATTTPITLEGYGTTPGDYVKVTIDGDVATIAGYSGNAWYIFKNLIVTGSSSNGVNAGSMNSCVWINCDFINNGSKGADLGNNHTMVNCVAYGNGTRGIDLSSGSTIGCISYSNGQEQIYGAGELAYRNVCYAPTTTYNLLSWQDGICIGNTIDGDSIASCDGLDFRTSITPIIIDNIVYDCDVGIADTTTPRWAGSFSGYNLLNSNTTDYSTSGPTFGIMDVTGAPAFTDEAGDDYTLGATSSAIDVGLMPGGIT